MGGRGTFAAGNSVDYSYKTVGEIQGIKVLQGIGNQHGLPESAHASKAYIKLDDKGVFREMCFYNSKHELYLEIGYHPEPRLTGNKSISVLHYHRYDHNFSRYKSAVFIRTTARKLPDAMKRKYKKFFKGVKNL